MTYELYEGANAEREAALKELNVDMNEVVSVHTPLWSDDEWVVDDYCVPGVYRMTLAELGELDHRQKTGKVSGPSFADEAEMHRERTSEKTCLCSVCRHRRGQNLELYAILAPPGGSTFVKEFAFYVAQGGLREKWGTNWIIIHAESLEGSRVEAIRRSGFSGLYCRVCGRDKGEACEHVLSGESR